MTRPIKFRAWNKLALKMVQPSDFPTMSTDTTSETGGQFDGSILMQFTGLLDKSEPCKEVYEGDIINEQGIILGNIYESSQILEKGNLVTITNMGTDAWRISESVAMGRGCKYAQ